MPVGNYPLAEAGRVHQIGDYHVFVHRMHGVGGHAHHHAFDPIETHHVAVGAPARGPDVGGEGTCHP